MNKHNVAWIVTFLVLGSVFVCSRFVSSTDRKVLAGEYGDQWPWPRYSSAHLNCRTVLNKDIVTIRLGSTTYGLNGPAQERYPDARSRMQLNEFGSPRLGATYSIISRGRKICDERGEKR